MSEKRRKSAGQPVAEGPMEAYSAPTILGVFSEDELLQKVHAKFAQTGDASDLTFNRGMANIPGPRPPGPGPRPMPRS